jgi:nucleoside-specific outer membrane channel protein Tsx
MRTRDNRIGRFRLRLAIAALVLFGASSAWAQSPATPATDAAKPIPESTKPAPEASKSWMDLYGFVMLDIGENFTRIHPDWYDTMRVSKLPSFKAEYGKNGDTFAGVRQTRFGVKTSTPTSLGELKTQFEFELFGTGVDAGQTTFRLRHAYGELGQFGAGQTWSPFMDPNVFPNSLEYWGPTGMVFFRNVQVRWMPIQGDTNLTIALERPGASADQGVYQDRIELQGMRARFPLPDLTGAYAYGGTWGYVRVGGALRDIRWDDTLKEQYDLSGRATGWGLNFSSNLNATKSNVVRLQFVYGKGIENYMNDAPVDIGIVNNFSDPVKPILGKPIPIYGTVVFLDHTWNAQWSSTVGYSRTDIVNTEGQAPNAYKTGQYALGNVLYAPVKNMLVGGEFQWGRRANFSDGFHSDGYKLQFSFKYNFSHRLGG